MRFLMFLAIVLFSSEVYAQNFRTTRNVWGGHNYFRNGKIEISSQRNVWGGYNYKGKVNGYSQPNVWGGKNYYLKNKSNNPPSRFVPFNQR